MLAISLDIFRMVDIELFPSSDEVDRLLREPWSDLNPRCNVAGCSVIFDTFREYQRHWKKVHMDTRLFRCPCGKQFGRKDRAKKHQADGHSVASDIAEVIVPNDSKIDPGNTLPLRPMTVEEKEREKRKQEASAKRKAAITTTFSLPSGYNSRDEEVNIIFDGNNSMAFRKRKDKIIGNLYEAPTMDIDTNLWGMF